MKSLNIWLMQQQKVGDYFLHRCNKEWIRIWVNIGHKKNGREGELGNLGVDKSPSLRQNGTSDSFSYWNFRKDEAKQWVWKSEAKHKAND